MVEKGDGSMAEYMLYVGCHGVDDPNRAGLVFAAARGVFTQFRQRRTEAYRGGQIWRWCRFSSVNKFRTVNTTIRLKRSWAASSISTRWSRIRREPWRAT